MLLLHDFGEDVAFAEDFDFLAIDFDFGSAVLAEEDFIADDHAHCRAVAAFEQPTGTATVEPIVPLPDDKSGAPAPNDRHPRNS